jgi:hypothetical protein
MNKAEFIFSIMIGLLLAPIMIEANAWAQSTDTPKTMRQRAQAWFESNDKKKRRLQMRQMTRALKQPCKYCHTAGFKGYTDRYTVSLEMMALSAEHDLRCDDCHAGKKVLTETGIQARKMKKVSKDLGVECTHCHVPSKKFKILTTDGEKYAQTLRDETNDKPRLQPIMHPPIPTPHLNAQPKPE